MGLWAPKRVIHDIHYFDRPETIRDRAKMNLAGHRDRRLSENYFEPWAMGSGVLVAHPYPKIPTVPPPPPAHGPLLVNAMKMGDNQIKY